MSNVTLSIGGRNFTFACADGEEDHVIALGHLIDAKITEAGAVGQTESRMLLFASLMLADTVHDLERRLGEASAPVASPAIAPELAERLDEIAGRIENLASVLESEAASA